MIKLPILGLIIILSFPFITGFLFMISFMLHEMIYREKGYEFFSKHSLYLHFLFLLIFFLPILVISIKINIIEKIIKFPLNLGIVLTIGLCSGIGIFLYYFEFYLTKRFRKVLEYLSFLKGRIIIGDKGILENYPSFFILVLLSLGIAFCEEFIWRGFLIRILINDFSLSIGVTTLISSFLFGINHYYFGLETIIVKILSGFIFAILFILTGNILAPFITHFTFNLFVWKKIVT